MTADENSLYSGRADEKVSDAGHLNSPLPALYLSHLDHYRFLRVSGPDAQSFLQGQCSCDFRELDIGEATLGTHCNPKGRMISSFLAAKTGDDNYVLRLHKSLVDIALAAFKKYAVFSKLSLNATEDLLAFGLIGPGADSAKLAPVQLRKAHHPELIEIWVATSDRESWKAPALTACGSQAWELQQLRIGLCEIRAGSSELFIPQELGMEKWGALSFKKGCFTGQEVIARLHYKGQIKKILAPAKVSRSSALAEGLALKNAGGDEIGQVVNWAPVETHGELLALVNNSAILQEEAWIGTEKVLWL